MHPDRMHLHHRMLKIGHSVQGAVLILWGWAALISFGSIMILFFDVKYVAIAFLCAAAVLTVLTMLPYLRHRIPEIMEEDAAYSEHHAAQHVSPPAGRGQQDRPAKADQSEQQSLDNQGSHSSSTNPPLPPTV